MTCWRRFASSLLRPGNPFVAKVSKMTIEERIARSIAKSGDKVFLRTEFAEYGGYDQVGRVLRTLVNKGRLVKAGYGVYVKAKVSSLTGKPIPAVPLTEICMSALSKLGVTTEMGSSDKAYMEGKTTQMPMAEVVKIKNSRVCRKIGFGSKVVRYEK